MGRDSAGSPHTVYQIRVKGFLRSDWEDFIGGLLIAHHPDADGCTSTTLTGPVVDQSALLGVLTHLHALNLELISVAQLTVGKTKLTESPGGT